MDGLVCAWFVEMAEVSHGSGFRARGSAQHDLLGVDAGYLQQSFSANGKPPNHFGLQSLVFGICIFSVAAHFAGEHHEQCFFALHNCFCSGNTLVLPEV